jgi:hypothetical protein
MRITETTYCEVTLEDENRYISHVFLQGDGKWKCLRCQRYRCEHARFVQQANPTLPPAPIMSVSDDEILTY